MPTVGSHVFNAIPPACIKAPNPTADPKSLSNMLAPHHSATARTTAVAVAAKLLEVRVVGNIGRMALFTAMPMRPPAMYSASFVTGTFAPNRNGLRRLLCFFRLCRMTTTRGAFRRRFIIIGVRRLCLRLCLRLCARDRFTARRTFFAFTLRFLVFAILLPFFGFKNPSVNMCAGFATTLGLCVLRALTALTFARTFFALRRITCRPFAIF